MLHSLNQKGFWRWQSSSTESCITGKIIVMKPNFLGLFAGRSAAQDTSSCWSWALLVFHCPWQLRPSSCFKWGLRISQCAEGSQYRLNQNLAFNQNIAWLPFVVLVYSSVGVQVVLSANRFSIDLASCMLSTTVSISPAISVGHDIPCYVWLLEKACGTSIDRFGPSGDIAGLLLQGAGNSWEFDVWALDKSVPGKTLSYLGRYLLKNVGLTSNFRLNEAKLSAFLDAVEDSYLSNPYHNRWGRSEPIGL